MEQYNQKWLSFLREQFPTGSRIRVRAMKGPDHTIPAGTEGTLTSIDDKGIFHVALGNGSDLGLVMGEDSFSVLPPLPHTLTFYMPLTGELYAPGDYAYDNPTTLNGRGLMRFASEIEMEIGDYRLDDEAERGIMHYHGKADSLDEKVRSAFFGVEAREGQLWGVVECTVIGTLTPEEVAALAEELGGQAADGWGEGFEEQAIDTHEGDRLHVHFYNFDNWDILTEEQRFGSAPEG